MRCRPRCGATARRREARGETRNAYRFRNPPHVHQPLIQTIVDVVVPRTVFGRTCLLGDAAFVVRPHTAGATAKVAREAMLLADFLQEAAGDLNSALSRFQSAQLRYGNELHQYGVALGSRWAAEARRDKSGAGRV